MSLLRRLPALLLLFAALAPALLAGRPVYQCGVSGTENLFCGCCETESEDVDTCCGMTSRPSEAGSGVDRLSQVTCGDCCTVTIYRGTCVKPRPDVEAPEASSSSVASVPEFEPTNHIRGRFTTNAARDRGTAPPLYLQNAVWRL